jgi:hypothetical protein
MNLEVYTHQKKKEWDSFISKSRNGIFLHFRDYMDYHAHLFSDTSVIFRKKNKVICVIPAHTKDQTFYTHQGLTFGGLILNYEATVSDVQKIFFELLKFLNERGYSSLYYKKIPHIFSAQFFDEDLHSLYAAGAKLVRRELSACINLKFRSTPTKTRMQMIKKAKTSNIIIRDGTFFEEFFSILSDVLQTHGTTPVHSPVELKLLSENFPKNIVLRGAFRGGKLVAGAVLYYFGRVVHTQYLAANDEGKRYSALDLIISETIETVKCEHQYFSFGQSTTKNGYELNEGLMFHKESFGARSLMLDHYELCLET